MILLELFWSFCKIGFTSFGGLSMVPLINSEMLSHSWMTALRGQRHCGHCGNDARPAGAELRHLCRDPGGWDWPGLSAPAWGSCPPPC